MGQVGCSHVLPWTWTESIAKSQHLRIVDNRPSAALQGSCHGYKGTSSVSLPLAFTAHQLTRAPIWRRFSRLSQNVA